MGLYLVIFTAFALAALRFPESENLGPMLFSALAGSVVAIFWVWSYSDGKIDDFSIRKLIYSGIAIDVLFNFVAVRMNYSSGISFPSSALAGVGNLGVLAAAIGVGLLAGRGLQKPNYLVMAAIVGAITDIFSVYAGPSKHIHVSQFFYYLSFQWGIIGQRGVQPIIGAGDFIFLTLYFFGGRKFGLDDRKTLWAMVIAVAVGFAATIAIGALPALPFMSSALLIVHGKELKAKMQMY